MDHDGGVITDFLQGKRVCVTGQLASMTHAELAELVELCGGVFLRTPRRAGFLLVVGNMAWAGNDNQDSTTHIFQHARRLRSYGYEIPFLTEEEFLERLGLIDAARAIRGQHTVSDLAQILAVSPQRIRRWVRQQLIQPTATVHGLAFFDFHQVANAKHLQQLLERGVSLAAIRRSVEELRECLPAEMLPLSQLSLLEGGRPLFRRDGHLIDSTGQRYFDFGASQIEPLVPLERNPLEEDLFELFDRAIELEDAEQFEAAADVYRQAVALEPEDPILHFNQGNVLFRLRQFEQAAVSFQEALTYDPGYVQAWNNLGNALAALQRFEDAEQAFRRAISLVPHYADPHFNLANLLARMGRPEEAERHHQKHQRFSSTELLAKVYQVVRQELGGDDAPP